MDLHLELHAPNNSILMEDLSAHSISNFSRIDEESALSTSHRIFQIPYFSVFGKLFSPAFCGVIPYFRPCNRRFFRTPPDYYTPLYLIRHGRVRSLFVEQFFIKFKRVSPDWRKQNIRIDMNWNYMLFSTTECDTNV